MNGRRRFLALAAFSATLAPAALGFSVLGTKWAMGPNEATHLAGHEGTPGIVSWSIMPGALPIHGFDADPDTHGGLLTGEFGGLLGASPSPAEEIAAITSAFSKWASVSGLSVLGPVMDGGVPGGAPEAIGGHLGDIRICVIGGFSSSSTLAHAFLPGTEELYGPHGTITGDVHVNADKDWVDDPFDPDDGALYDLETVLLHEIGHSLGLGHSDLPGSVMFGSYEGGKRTLTSDDIDGIKFIYGPEAVPEPATLAVLGVGAAALMRRRRTGNPPANSLKRRLNGG
jgi:hypothetical protein